MAGDRMTDVLGNEGLQANQASPTDGLLDRLIRQAQEESPPPAAQAQAAPSASSAPLGGLLGGLASNPALLQALPQLLSVIGKPTGGAQQSNALPQGENASAPPSSRASVSVDRHTALLCAVKPYLSRERQRAAEYMISLCRVWSTLQGMGISLPMLMSSLTGGSVSGSPEDKEV